MQDALSLTEALAIISGEVHHTAIEKQEVENCLGRITASSLFAKQDYPLYTQSLFDGYAISKTWKGRLGNVLNYDILGEIAAGQSKKLRCRAGGAYRIMTGAPLPQGAWKVIPQEYCQLEGEFLKIQENRVVGSGFNIKKKGADIGIGKLLVKKGVCLSPPVLARLTDGGVATAEIYRQPRVALFCSGSELIETPKAQGFGKKLSSNKTLLAGLIRSFGGKLDYYGTVADEHDAISEMLQKVIAEKPDIVISTGGMGPGKYDLLKEGFRVNGGDVRFSALRLRPGKSTLFGRLGGSLYFGLPGPPPAVFALFHALIRPTLLKMQGYGYWNKQRITARLKDTISFPKTGVVRLLEGVMMQKYQEILVRRAYPGEYADCLILCAANRKTYAKGSVISVLPTEPPAYLR